MAATSAQIATRIWCNEPRKTAVDWRTGRRNGERAGEARLRAGGFGQIFAALAGVADLYCRAHAEQPPATIASVRNGLRQLADCLRAEADVPLSLSAEVWLALLGRYPGSNFELEPYSADSFAGKENGIAFPSDLAASKFIIKGFASSREWPHSRTHAILAGKRVLKAAKCGMDTAPSSSNSSELQERSASTILCLTRLSCPPRIAFTWPIKRAGSISRNGKSLPLLSTGQ